MDRHQHSFDELLAVVRRLPAITPQAAKLPVNGYETFQEQWIGWLEEYDGPGYYGRAVPEVGSQIYADGHQLNFLLCHHVPGWCHGAFRRGR